MYLDVLVIAEYLDNILFSQKFSKIVFENENLATFKLFLYAIILLTRQYEVTSFEILGTFEGYL